MRSIEWPTLIVAACIYLGFGLLTWFYAELPIWLVIPLAAYLLAWHGSLQHEVVHGHPTPWPWFNRLLIFPSLWLWMPFEIYQTTHRQHHQDQYLTDPLEDPESYYLTAEHWQSLGYGHKKLLEFNNTALGRLLLGPLLVVYRLFLEHSKRLLSGDTRYLGIWGLHLAAGALVLCWTVWVCQIPVWEYIVFIAYPGLSLSLLRSFLEHQARPEISNRTVLVESGVLMSLMFLYNNLHVVHHTEPGLPWYQLKHRYQQNKEALLASNGHYWFRGYGEIIWRYLITPKEPVQYPLPVTIGTTTTR